MRYTVKPHPYATRFSVFRWAVMRGEELVEGFACREDARDEAARLNAAEGRRL